MLTLTRSDALAHARYVFTRLAMRAYEASEPDREYIHLIARSWDERLAELARSAAASQVAEDTWRILDSLTNTVNDPALTPDALVDWVDAFPDAVADLFPPPAIQIDGADEVDAPQQADDEIRAGNRQSTLALAA